MLWTSRKAKTTSCALFCNEQSLLGIFSIAKAETSPIYRMGGEVKIFTSSFIYSKSNKSFSRFFCWVYLIHVSVSLNKVIEDIRTCLLYMTSDRYCERRHGTFAMHSRQRNELPFPESVIKPLSSCCKKIESTRVTVHDIYGTGNRQAIIIRCSSDYSMYFRNKTGKIPLPFNTPFCFLK